jgi:hypothetical protein
MPNTDEVIKIFVSYSHHDSAYLEDNPLLGYLQGLEKEQIEFWTDRQIRVGALWDEVIKTHIQEAHIALMLVSQSFLDSADCQDVEIRSFLAAKSYRFPIILSPCEWQRHEWLRSRQFLPGGRQTIEEHYTDPSQLKRLFLEIRQQLRERTEQLRQAPPSAGSGPVSYSGKTQLTFVRQLGDSWQELAMVLNIPAYDQSRFERGGEGRGIWVWLSNRQRLVELPQALHEIDRPKLAALLRQTP